MEACATAKIEIAALFPCLREGLLFVEKFALALRAKIMIYRQMQLLNLVCLGFGSMDNDIGNFVKTALIFACETVYFQAAQLCGFCGINNVCRVAGGADSTKNISRFPVAEHLLSIYHIGGNIIGECRNQPGVCCERNRRQSALEMG